MTLEKSLTHPAIQALGWALLSFAWQGIVLAALLFVTNVLTQRSQARLRYAIGCVVMLLMVVVFVSTVLRSYPPAGTVVVGQRVGAAIVPEASLAENRFWPSTRTVVLPIIETPSIRMAMLRTWAAWLWLAGFLLFSAKTFGGWVCVQRLRRRSIEPVDPAWIGTLQGLMRRLRVSGPLRLYTSAIVEAPTVIGWLSPYILLPISVVTGLGEAELEAVLAHELSHIRRYDYLVNLLQNAVETLLFYHPAVWWVSRRIREEREHCCDDLAVGICGDVMTYAGALARLEELRGTSRAPGIAATGGNLLARIRRLMQQNPANERSTGEVMAAALILSAAIGAGILTSPPAHAQTAHADFEVASVKESKSGSREMSWGCGGSDGKTLSEVAGDDFHIVGYGDVPIGRCVARNAPLKFVVALAYQIPWDQMNQVIVGGPEWFSSGIGAPERYDIDAKAEQIVTKEQLFQMLQTLLADRFQLKVHTATKEIQVYELIVSKKGATLTNAPDDRDCSVIDATAVPCHNFIGGFGRGLTGRSVTMADLAVRLSRYAGPIVIDKTGIIGDYDVKLSDFWVPFLDAKSPGSVPTLFDAVQDQLGLKLKATKDPVDVLIVDHAEKPSLN
jgi:uncharacterized protein (TIGR03435 family)